MFPRFSCIPYLMLFPLLSFSQKDSIQVRLDTITRMAKRIPESYLENYRDNPEFDYGELQKEPTWWDGFKGWLGNVLLDFFEWLFGVEKASGLLANFLNFLPYLLLAVLLFLLIKFFLNVNARSLFHAQKNKTLVVTSEEEHIIRTQDILQLIEQALAAGNHRLAVRYYYLYILKTLSDKKLIDWQQQKTNADYLTELGFPELKEPFGRIIRLYNYIWYGHFEIDEARYRRLEPVFAKFKTKILEHG